MRNYTPYSSIFGRGRNCAETLLRIERERIQASDAPEGGIVGENAARATVRRGRRPNGVGRPEIAPGSESRRRAGVRATRKPAEAARRSL
jgi:hypothetical protein